MTSRAPQDCESMDHVRAEIDRLDIDLVRLMADRFRYVDRAWQLKKNPEDAIVPWRIQQVIDRVKAHADNKNVPPELVEALWRQMIGWFIQYEEQQLGEKGREK